MDFGRPGVVDPMVHRFGMIYDISKFSETLGNIRRGGEKEEIKSYRQMLMFQRKLDAIAERHLLQFEKFLGDGAFYTTRRALRIVRAAVEIQRRIVWRWGDKLMPDGEAWTGPGPTSSSVPSGRCRRRNEPSWRWAWPRWRPTRSLAAGD